MKQVSEWNFEIYEVFFAMNREKFIEKSVAFQVID